MAQPKPLIEKTSALYLRRLSREVTRNASTRGAYYDGKKVLRAKFSDGKLLVQTTDSNSKWIPAANPDGFFDGSSRQICASRTKAA